MDQNQIIIVSVFGAANLVLLLMVMVLFVQLAGVKRRLRDISTSTIRVQKLTMSPDNNHAFHNPGLAPDEELSRRGYSMYIGEDVELGRRPERQISEHFVEELTREIDHRQHRNNAAPPFLLQSIEENKRMSKTLNNPVANGRQSVTNPNFIY